MHADEFCPDGLNPVNGLLRDAQGSLYGETLEGGANGVGTVFELTGRPAKPNTTFASYTISAALPTVAVKQAPLPASVGISSSMLPIPFTAQLNSEARSKAALDTAGGGQTNLGVAYRLRP
jgi:hypothetical protein